MEYLAILAVIGIFILIIAKKAQNEKQERLHRELEFTRIAEAALKDLQRAENAVKGETQARWIRKAAQKLFAARRDYPDCTHIVENFEETLAGLKAKEKVLPMIDPLEKAAKARFKENDSAEKNALLDALYQAKLKKVTDKDIKKADIVPDGMDGIVLMDDLRDRLHQLGWSESESNTGDAR